MTKHVGLVALAVSAILVMTTAVAVAGGALDFGVFPDHQMASLAKELLAVKKPLDASSTASSNQATADSDPTKLATLAKGLQARGVTTLRPAVDDQISLWPNDTHPTYLIACNEQGEAQPGLVRIQ